MTGVQTCALPILANEDSSNISRTMGTANKNIARSILPVVKSLISPRMACLNSFKIEILLFSCINSVINEINYEMKNTPAGFIKKIAGGNHLQS